MYGVINAFYIYILIYTNTIMLQVYSHSLHCIMTKLDISSSDPFSLQIFDMGFFFGFRRAFETRSCGETGNKTREARRQSQQYQTSPWEAGQADQMILPKMSPWVWLNLWCSALGAWPCLTCHWKWGWTNYCSPRRDAGLYSHEKNLIYMCHFCV